MTVLSLETAQQRVEDFLTKQLLDAFRATEYDLPTFDAAPPDTSLAEASRSKVELRHVRGASDCTYLVHAFGDALLVQVQLNVFRLVVVYRVPAINALDVAGLEPRLERWRIGAQHAGWTIGWRDALGLREQSHSFIETYCYAFAQPNFLEDALQQLYWRTDIVQMTRYFMLEMKRLKITLSPRQAGFEL
ncbi:MAG: hypothetical protein JO021_17545 [Alphaproteobacteria bacterium]|nr:hypothetical protein [Alphaproteobacteria bacterium]